MILFIWFCLKWLFKRGLVCFHRKFPFEHGQFWWRGLTTGSAFLFQAPCLELDREDLSLFDAGARSMVIFVMEQFHCVWVGLTILMMFSLWILMEIYRLVWVFRECTELCVWEVGGYFVVFIFLNFYWGIVLFFSRLWGGWKKTPQRIIEMIGHFF